ncbi:unnamed protein product [Rhizoctonia solani]|uniref:Flap endonuclease 1 n=1 Tax=Rhizoctonia solani TaxID=456999 RepID=A0A8H2WUN2_9AGAM|nr:unnamed protein product [Rhizoctonia solani]
MGIKGLTGLLSEHAPASIKEHDIKTLFGRKVAIDASMSIYHHLMGFFYRTLRMVDHGIKPAYVFDGKPPDLKSGVLSKRFEGRQKAKEDGEEAKEVGTAEDVEKFARRTVRVTREHNEECRKLLKLMGIPCVVAPSEAEAQCAELARGGKVYAAGSEDMDTLTFNAPVLYRHLTFSEAKKAPISEIVLEKALEGLDMNMEQFTELCILLGCDYLEPIKGVGPKNAFKLMQEHGSLKEVLDVLRAKMAEREEADHKKDHKAKSTSKKGSKTSKSKKKDEDDEDEAMESEEEETLKPRKQKSSKPKNRIESDDEGEGSDPWDDTQVATSPARGSSPTRGSSPPASSEAGMKVDEDEDVKPTGAAETKEPIDDDKDHKMEDFEAKVDDAEAKADEVPKKPAPIRRGGIHVPEYYPWEEAKKLFLQPDVTPADQIELVWEAPDVDGLVQFLVVEKGFNEERVRKGAEKLTKMLNTKQQGRLDGFFKVTESASSKAKATVGKGTAGNKGAGAKRKADDKKDTGGKKAKTGGKR